MRTIIKKLHKNLPPDCVVTLNNPDQVIYQAEIITPETTFDDIHTLYIGRSQDISPDASFNGISLMTYSKELIPEDRFSGKYNAIQIKKEAECVRLYGIVMQDLNDVAKLTRINNELLSMVKSGAGLQKIMDYSSLILKNPVMLIDISFTYIASAGADSFPDQYNWQYTLDNGVMPSSYLNHIMNSEVPYLSSEYETSDIIISDTDENNAHRTFSLKVFNRKTQLGYFKVIETNHEFIDSDMDKFELLNDYIGLVLGNEFRKSSYNDNISEGFLSSILTNKVDSDSAIESLKETFSLNLNSNLCLIRISFNTAPSFEDTQYYVLKKVKRFFNSDIVCYVRNSFVVLAGVQSEGNNFASSFAKKFKDLLKEINCRADVSFVFKQLEELYRYYQQTLFCEEYRIKTDNDDPILYYKDIYEYHMIAKLNKDLDLRSVIHPAIRELYFYDKKTGSDLTVTLIEYIKHHQSIPDTSKDLFIHYNTLKHRLEKISEFTDFKQADASESFRIMMSEKILNYYGWGILDR